jgi:hypothetical protein
VPQEERDVTARQRRHCKVGQANSRPGQQPRLLLPHQPRLEEQRSVIAILEKDDMGAPEGGLVKEPNKPAEQPPAKKSCPQPAHIEDCRHPSRSCCQRAVKIRLDRPAEVGGGLHHSKQATIGLQQRKIFNRTHSRPVHFDRR